MSFVFVSLFLRVKAEGGNIHMVPKKNVCRFLVLSFFKYQAMSNNNFYYIYIKQYLNSFVFYRIKYLGSSKNLWNQTIKFYATKHTLTTFLNIFCNCFVGFSYFRSYSEWFRKNIICLQANEACHWIKLFNFSSQK